MCVRRYNRWRKTNKDGRTGGYRAKNQRLTEQEKDAIIAAVNIPEYANMSLRATQREFALLNKKRTPRDQN